MKAIFTACAGVFGAGLTLLATTAAAAPIGLEWTVNEVFVGGEGFYVGRLYVCYDNPMDVLLNVFNANIQIIGGNFNHNDSNTGGANSPFGSWSPNAYLPAPFNIGNPAIDSYVSIGGFTSDVFVNGNSTSFDPSFSATATGVSGGWFNGNPPNLQGQSQPIPGLPGFYTLIGQFARKSGCGQSLSVSIKQTSNQGLGTPSYPQTELSGLFVFGCPAPGALALLALAGAAQGRRRRVG